MSSGKKRFPGQTEKKGLTKTVSGERYSSAGEKVVWHFDLLDRDGPFAFDLRRPDFDHQEVLEKIIAYSNMTWAEVLRQTHDNGKSKHHMLDVNALSPNAKARIQAKHLEAETDAIFSFALQNRLRLIGLRMGGSFHVVCTTLFVPAQKNNPLARLPAGLFYSRNHPSCLRLV